MSMLPPEMLPHADTARWKARNPSHQILFQRGPFSTPFRPHTQHLATEDLRPVIRLAHRWRGPLVVSERIIYDHELVLIIDGQGDLVVGREVTRFGPGDLLFIRPFVPHEYRLRSATTDHMAIHFDLAPRFPSHPDAPPMRAPYEVRLEDGLEIASRVAIPLSDRRLFTFASLVSEWGAHNRLGTLRAEALLMELVVSLIRTTAASPDPATAGDARIARVVEFMAAHQGDPLTVGALAAHVGMAETSFKRLFGDTAGTSPGSYQRRLRMQRARELLLDRTLPVKAVALQTGFRDPNHFSRAFHLAVGEWPTGYRTRLLGR